MQTRTLGTNGPVVSALGLGAMGMTNGVYGANDRAESIATVHAALDAGVTLIDTSDHYGSGHNEMLLGEALKTLNERERHILIERRLKDEPTTLEELSQQYNISRERVRQIEVRAFEKLQKSMKNQIVERRLAV